MNTKEYEAKGEIRKFYENKPISLLTKHKKEKIIAPILAEATGCHMTLVLGYDTDQLGTFTREIPRIDNQIDTARKKARIGMDLLGLSLGMASEGSFGPDPFTGLMPWNRELIVLIDDDMETEIIGQAQGPGNQQYLITSDWQEAVKFATKVGFPDQYLIVRPENGNNPKIHKDINEWSKFESIFFSVASVFATGQVFIETDGRAHGNPERRKMIAKAAEDLVNNMGSFCPACGIPGFSVVQRLPGLPCMHCGRPTRITYAELWLCKKCGEHEKREFSEEEMADPMYCDFCNP